MNWHWKPLAPPTSHQCDPNASPTPLHWVHWVQQDLSNDSNCGDVKIGFVGDLAYKTYILAWCMCCFLLGWPFMATWSWRCVCNIFQTTKKCPWHHPPNNSCGSNQQEWSGMRIPAFLIDLKTNLIANMFIHFPKPHGLSFHQGLYWPWAPPCTHRMSLGSTHSLTYSHQVMFLCLTYVFHSKATARVFWPRKSTSSLACQAQCQNDAQKGKCLMLDLQ